MNVETQTQPLTVQLFDMQGREQEVLIDKKLKIDVSALKSGIYFLVLTFDKELKVEKIVVK